jgi:hypothetical protein
MTPTRTVLRSWPLWLVVAASIAGFVVLVVTDDSGTADAGRVHVRPLPRHGRPPPPEWRGKVAVAVAATGADPTLVEVATPERPTPAIVYTAPSNQTVRDLARSPDGARLALVVAPAWSPDGRRIAYVSAISGAGDSDRSGAVVVVPAEAGARRKVSGVCEGHDPTWAPDSRTVYVAAGWSGGQGLVEVATTPHSKVALPGRLHRRADLVAAAARPDLGVSYIPQRSAPRS